jgi:hypothetical protein
MYKPAFAPIANMAGDFRNIYTVTGGGLSESRNKLPEEVRVSKGFIEASRNSPLKLASENGDGMLFP